MTLKAQGPLVGIRVLELCEGQAGPYCGTILSDLGAEVIKIESCTGDYTRRIGPFKNGESSYFISYNRGKKGIAMNFAAPEAVEIIKQLAVKSDIFMENLEPGEINAMGLDYESIAKMNPSIIYGSVSCYGRTGPLSGFPGNDIVAEAMGGHTYANGRPDGPPEPLGIAISDHCGGAEFTWVLLCAYVYKMLTGKGQYIDVSVADKDISANDNQLTFATMVNKTFQRTGGYNPNIGPYGVFLAADGAYAMGCGTNDMWGRVSKIIGKPELHVAEGWATPPERGRGQMAQMVPLLNEWGKDKKRDDIVKLIRDEHMVPCGPCQTHKEVQRDAHYRKRETVVDIEQPKAGKVSVASAYAGKMSETKPYVQGPAPLLGEHNEDVLASLLSLSSDEITRLYKENVLMRDLTPKQPV